MRKIIKITSIYLTLFLLIGCHLGSTANGSAPDSGDYQWPSTGPVSEQYLKTHCKADPKLTLIETKTQTALISSPSGTHQMFDTAGGPRPTCVATDATGQRLCQDTNPIEVVISTNTNAISLTDMQQNYHPAGSRVYICGEAYLNTNLTPIKYGLHFVHQKIVNQKLIQYGFVAVENPNEHKFYMISA